MKRNKLYKLIPMLGLLGFASSVPVIVSGCSSGDSQPVIKDNPIPQEALIINASGILQGFKTKFLTDDMNVLIMPSSANDIQITNVSLPVFKNIHKLYIESQSLTNSPRLNQNSITYSQLFPSLELLDMSNRTDSMSWGTFNNMPNLTHLKLGDMANFNGYTFTNCPALNDIEIANGVTSITKIDNIENGNIVGQIVVPSNGLTATTYNTANQGTLA
jgi:Leucine-rich repeat (LRR) protein